MTQIDPEIKHLMNWDATMLAEMKREVSNETRLKVLNLFRVYQLSILTTAPNGSTELMPKEDKEVLLLIEALMQLLGCPPEYIV
jgi:hypothetical protein